MTVRIFIDGEAGTTGLQIRQRLADRSDLEIIAIAPDKRKDMDERKRLLNKADIAILCLPDNAARESVCLIENDTTRVIDASTAFRVAPDWIYGFAEMDREQTGRIARARFVSNPGCWPQGLIAHMRPLIAAGLIPADFPVIYNGVSGYSGGGKAMIAEYEAAASATSPFMAYGLTYNHKHVPEMIAYTRLLGAPLFMPAVGAFAQGMVTFVPLQLGRLDKVPSGAAIHAVLAEHYTTIENSFVVVAPLGNADKLPEMDPQTHNGTSRMSLHVFANDARAQVVLAAVYDNLGKGAAGAAVQNLNIMMGVDAREGLAG